MQISGVEESYEAGQSVAVTCTTDLSFNTINWVNELGVRLSEEDSEPSLILTDSFSATSQLTCRIESNFGDQEMTIKLTVMDPGKSTGTNIGAIVGGIVGGLLALFLCGLIMLLICCCLGIQ